MKLFYDTKDKVQAEENLPKPRKSYRLSGFALLGLLGGAGLAGSFLALSDLPGFMKANYVLVRHSEVAPALFTKNDLEEVRLDVKFKHFQKIKEKRRQALNRGLLEASSEDFVPGKITSGDESIECKLRLKGDLSDHWAFRKWSLRVDLKGDDIMGGMSRFSLQNPVTRGYTCEWLFLSSLRREDLAAVRYRFVNLTLNGKEMGVYAMEEHFSKVMTESLERREGVVVAFDEYLLWKKFPVNLQDNVNWSSIYRTSSLEVRNSGRVERSPTLRKQRTTAFNLLRGLQEGTLSGDEVFAVERVGKFLALCRLWNAERGLLFADVNFYFDPVTSLLEPIGFDGNPSMALEAPYCYFSWGDIPDNWVNQALRSPRIAKAYMKNLAKFAQPSYLNTIRKELGREELHLRRILLKDLLGEDAATIWKADSSLLQWDPWSLLEARAKRIRKELSEERPVMAYARPAEGNPRALEVIVRNALTQPVEVLGFERGPRMWDAREVLSDPEPAKALICPIGNTVVMPLQHFGNHPIRDHRFHLGSYVEGNSSVSAETETTGPEPLFALARILGNPVAPLRIPVAVDSARFRPDRLPFANRSEPLEAHSFLLEEGSILIVPPGRHEINHDLVIPPGRELLMTPGAELHFAPGATLISESPIRAEGTPEAPVVFTALGERWGGMLVSNAQERTLFSHVRISKVGGVGVGVNPGGIERDGWTMTGGLTFHHSPVDFQHCRISRFESEDALNIIGAGFVLREVTFSEVVSDAFDGDFVEGSIVNCLFEEVGGDAIDLSGSRVRVEGTKVFGAADKGLSAGEATQVSLHNCHFERVGFGIAAKDHSEVRVSGTKVIGAKVAGVAAYQKKKVFGPAKVKGLDLKVTETDQAHLVQTGSSVELDGRRLKTVHLDVEALYEKEAAAP